VPGISDPAYGLVSQTLSPFGEHRLCMSVDLFFGCNALSIRGQVDRDYSRLIDGDIASPDTKVYVGTGVRLRGNRER